MRQGHRNQILAAHDIGRIDRSQIGRIDVEDRNSFFIEDLRLVAWKGKSVGTEDPALAEKVTLRIEPIGESEIEIVFATAAAEMMPMMQIGARRNGIVLPDLRSFM